jgi:hypothetical protein
MKPLFLALLLGLAPATAAFASPDSAPAGADTTCAPSRQVYYYPAPAYYYPPPYAYYYGPPAPYYGYYAPAYYGPRYYRGYGYGPGVGVFVGGPRVGVRFRL